METVLQAKAIQDLMESEEKFYIPSYQRGYRWSKLQVRELLDDLWEFHEQDPAKDEVYWLQPIIVKKNEETWEVIDGQQRLTTILILLQYIKKQIPFLVDHYFSIDYETRPKSSDFLRDIAAGENMKDDNIDFYHMYEAYEMIQEWFAEHKPQAVMFIAQRLREQVKVMWYEVDDSYDAIDIFSRINNGRIPLTNAELIKALFLSKNHLSQNEGDEDIVRLKQIEISNEWDRMEYALQNDELWYFLQNDTDSDYQNRIEWLFDLIASDYKMGVEKNIPYYTFHVFNEWMKNQSEADKSKHAIIESIWLEVQQLYMKVTEWYQNRELYHYIGYLLATSVSMESIIQKSNNMKKDAFVEILKEMIRSSFEDVDIVGLMYEDSKQVRHVLLLFNILTLQNDVLSNQRFDFERYKKEKWDIEHIHAVKSKKPHSTEAQSQFLNEALPYVKDEELRLAINSFLAAYDQEQFEGLFERIVDEFGDDETNNISNLTLLDATTNRSYKNAIFPKKRQILIERDKTGVYIPACTRNVFLKYYNPDVTQMNYWGKKDREHYINAMVTALSTVIPSVKESAYI
ncbi:DUF262 domain-containing protein [Bacillus sp. PK3_68]|uniref:DUF262 domain-containing protein n=1 Tax=Bacillus sp. PK3_68 TaxID=2027408 RepID=UPI000E746341|nr:DUF262 domain-containing protein [Bacillus sp. PK3_68]RJS61764.1 hypothetical protein CJ483_18400 [Bacillus sp. PK3_68]